MSENAVQDLAGKLASLTPERRLLLQRMRRKRQEESAAAAPPVAIRTAPFSLISEQDRRKLPADVEDAYPLAMLQQGMLYHMQVATGSAVYHNVDSYHLRGVLDERLFREAVARVVARHPMLRTGFDLASYSEPMQLVHGQAVLPIEVEDVRHLVPAEQEAVIGAHVAAERWNRFDLSRPPLLRFKLFRRSDASFQFTMTEHHAIFDGWSLQSTLAEMWSLHAALRRGEPLPPEEPPGGLCYRDFVHLERATLASPVCRRFWAGQLDGCAPLRLPRRAGGDAPAPPVSVHVLEIPLAPLPDLERLARRLEVPIKTVFFAAHLRVMSFLGGDSEVMTGLVMNGRPEELGGEQIRGLFLNTVPLRLDLAGGSWEELIRQTFRTETGLLPFRRYPLTALQKEWGGGEPLFETACSYAHFHVLGDIFRAGEVELLYEGSRVFDETHFAIMAFFQQYPASSRLDLVLSCDAERFSRGQVEAIGGYYRNALAAMAANPTARYELLDLLSAEERHQMLVEWNATGSVFPDVCIHRVFAEQAARTPKARAVLSEEGETSYCDLDRQANRLARYLRRRGVGPEVRVGLCLERSLQAVTAILAILKAGGAYVPLDPSYPAERLALMAEDAELLFVLTDSRLADRLPVGTARVIHLDRIRKAVARESRGELPGGSAESLAYVMYTSGSTGLPKGVGVVHRNVVRLVRGIDYVRLGTEEIFLQLAPLSFDASTLEIWGCLLNGGCLVILPPAMPTMEALGRAIEHHRISVLWLTAGLFHVMVEGAVESLRGVLQLLAGGDVLSVPHVRKVLTGQPGGRLINGYGPTEGTTFTCCHSMAEPYEVGSPVPIGRPIANARVYVLDSRLQPVPPGVAGELLIGGDGLARGYLGRPDLTAERFVPDPFGPPGSRLYRTGDLARYLPDGLIDFVGRTDLQVKVRGFRIEPGEIEAVLAGLPEVREAVVLARAEAAGGKRLVAYVVANGGGAPTPGSLRELLRDHLPEHMIPSAFVVLDTLPLTPNGKVDRRALPAPEQTEAEEASAGPRGLVEEVLAAIWSEVLGVVRVGMRDDFFELGGHSLLATRVMSRVQRSFGIELPLRTLFEAPTVAALAGRIDLARRGPAGIPAPPLDPLPRELALSLSFAQQRLWFLDQLEPGSPLYNIPVTLSLAGPLDIAALAESFGAIVRRQESLRTTFLERNDEVVQSIQPAAPVPLPTIDLNGLPEAGRGAEVRRLTAAEARRPFDLQHGPLFRTALVRLTAEDHVALASMHHIVSDGWSMGIFVHEVEALYAAFREGRPPSLPELPVQYADFAGWQRRWLRGEVLEGEIAHWRERLAGAPPVLELPADRPRPPVSSFAGAVRTRRLAGELYGAVAALARRMGATPFMVLLAAFHVLLSRLSGQDDVSVGTPVAGRTRMELEGLIGFFVNVLVLRGNLADDPPFERFLEATRETALEAHGHQDLPFEKLVEALQPERSLSHAPLFQVLFLLQSAAQERSEPGDRMAGLRLKLMDGVETGTAKFDLTLALTAGGDGFAASAEHSTDLFDGTSIDRLLGHLEVLLHGIVADPGQRVLELPLLSADERAQSIAGWNRTARQVHLDRSFHELFAARAERTPDAVAVACGTAWRTYAELEEESNRLARTLIAEGVGGQGVVALLAERGVGFLTALLGLWKAGGAYLPLDPRSPASRLARLLGGSGPSLVLVAAEDLSGLARAAVEAMPAEQRPRLLILEDLSGRAGSTAALPPRNGPADLAYVLYTSGSTGVPKGAMIEHGGMMNHLHAKVDDLGLTGADVVAQTASQAFDISVWQLLAVLLTGGRVEVFPDEVAHDPALLLDRIEATGVTILETVPSLLRFLLQEIAGRGERPALAALRWLIPTGEALAPELCRQWLALYPRVPLLNAYGPTECSDDVTHHPIREAPDAALARVPIGRPVANLRVYVLDRRFEPAPVGVTGELAVGGAGVGRGYLGEAVRTAEAFVPDPFGGEPRARLYRTGDLARRLPGGELDFLGRADGQVKIRGFRIELGEIESALARCPGIGEGAVAPWDDGDARHLVAYVAPEAGQAAETIDVDELRATLKEQLPDYMVPSLFVVLATLPLSANGKLDRQALPKPDPGLLPGDGATVGPRTPAEEILAGIWSEVLGLARVGVHDNFFELGGHSLLATRVMSRVRRSFGMEMPLRALFEAPTVAGLAGLLVRERPGPASPQGPAIGPAPGDAALPLSFAQQRLWFIDQWEPGSPLYNIPMGLRLTGTLDTAALAASFDEIVRRQDALRTTFEAGEDEPVQVVHPAAAAALSLVDLAGLPEVESGAELWRLTQLEARRPFDLARGPLFRTGLLRLAAEEHILLVTMHHIVSDGWSVAVFTRELATLYDAFSQGLPSPLPELPVRYADFAVWQRRWLGGEVLEAELAYWRGRLAGAPALLELPTDRPRPPVQSFRGSRAALTLSRELSAALASLSRRSGATLFITLLGAFQALLSRYSGQDDLSVGTPIAGRTHLEIEGLIGFFVNTLVLRCDLAADPAFHELLARVREVVLEAHSHQTLPFEKLVEELAPERSLSHPPLFQVMLVLQNAGQEAVRRLSGLRIEGLEGIESGTAKFDLTLALEEAEGGLVGSLEYSSDLFDRTTIERMLGHLARLLEGVADDPETRVSALLMLGAAEYAQLLTEWNPARHVPVSVSLHQLFEAQADRDPNVVALRFEGESLTYGEVEARANRLAHRLRALGTGPESLVGLCLERSPELVVAILAVLKAGGAYVPLDPSHPKDRLSFLIADSGMELLVTAGSSAAALPAGGPRRVLLDTDLAAPASAARLSSEGTEALAYAIYTSGSTGRPKGVLVTHTNVVQLLWATEEDFGFGPGDVWTLFHSYAFDFSVWELWGALAWGGRLVIVPYWVSRSPRELHELLVRERVTILNQTPSAFRQLAGFEFGEEENGGADALPCLRLVIFGGEALDPASLRLWLARHGDRQPRLVNMYGITETTVHVTSRPLGRADTEAPGASPIGSPLAHLEVHLLGRQGELLPVGVPGEIHVGGAGLARGYLGRPDLTAERFVPDPFSPQAGARLYRAGDLARRLPDGTLAYLGRIDHQVKVRGFRIELGEIETALCSHPAVSEALVLARRDGGPAGEEPPETRLVAYVVRSAGEPVTAGSLRESLALRLPEHMLPAAVVFLEAFPLTTNGKVDRRALPPPGERPEALGANPAPLTPTEEIVAAIWSDLLGIERIAGDDSFFELGGHSLLATQVMSRVRWSFGVELPLRALFESPTVAGLAVRIERERTEGAGWQTPPLKPAPQGADLPLSFAQERLWFLDQLEPGSPLYNIPITLSLAGVLDIAILTASLGEVVRRHEALRTTFASREGEPTQVIHPAAAVPLPLIDLSGLPVDLRPAEVRRLVALAGRRSFDLVRGPLLRCSLVRLDTADHQLLATLHHVIADGWSIGIFTRELVALYVAFSEGQPSDLPALPVQYAHFARWQRSWLQGDVLAAQVVYWRDRLADVPSLLELSTDRPRPGVQKFHGAGLSQGLPMPLTLSLAALARRSGATLFMTLLAAFQTLLSRLSRQEDVCVGTPIAGRTQIETERLIGLFVNSLVMRSELAGDPSFREVLARVREAMLQAYAHQDLPFEKLVEELEPERSLSHSPLFQVMLVLQNLGQEREGQAAGLRLKGLEEVGTGTSKFDLTLSLEQTEAGLRGVWEYDSDLFDGTTVERLAGHLEALLSSATASPDRRLSELSLLTPEQHGQLVVEWNDTAADYPADLCLPELFVAQARRTPEALAVACEGRELTYGELDRRSNRLAHFLHRSGVGPDVVVGIQMERSLEMVVGLLGILKAGGAYLPLDSGYPRERLASMLEQARVPVLLTQGKLAALLPACAARVLCLDTGWPALAAQPSGPPPSALLPHHPAYVMFTSGSTGAPKGVINTHLGIVNRLLWMQEEYGLEAEDRVLQKTPFGFDVSVWELFSPLLVGARLVMAAAGGHQDSRYLVQTVLEQGITTVHFVPSMLRAFLEEQDVERCVSLIRVLCSGEALSTDLVRRFFSRTADLEAELHNLYGPTEAAVDVTSWACERGLAHDLIPIGRPVANTEIHLLDPDGSIVPVGVPGELHIGGVQLARGYFGRPELTAERFVPNPLSTVEAPGSRLYRTGDLARRLPGGTVEYLDRMDHQVKIRGFRIELGEIESVLLRHGTVGEAVVMMREDAPGDRRLVAYLVPTPGERTSDSDLRGFLRERLPDYMVPSIFMPLESLPLGRNGKLDRRALPSAEAARPAHRERYVAPRDTVELRLAQIWEELLGVQPIGVRDNFFAIGGHSLLATRLMARIRKHLGRELPLAALFQASSIESLGALLRRQGGPLHRTTLVEIRPGDGDGRRPLFCVHPVGGDVLCYADLAHALAPGQPFYGLQAAAAGPTSPERIEEMAGLYLDAVRTVQPQGPYLLAGWSMGGLVAFEMAHQLHRQGKAVALLALIDATAPATALPEEESHLSLVSQFALDLWGISGSDLALPVEDLSQLGQEELLRLLFARALQAGVLPPELELDQLRRSFDLFTTNLRALKRYEGKVYAGGATLIRAAGELPDRRADPALGWAGLIAGGIELLESPGDHYTMVRRPHAEGLANLLTGLLDRAHES